MDFDLGEINEKKKSCHLGGLNCRVVSGKWLMSYDTIELDFDATLSNVNIFGRVVASKEQQHKHLFRKIKSDLFGRAEKM